MKVIRGVNVFPTQVETALLSMGGGVAPVSYTHLAEEYGGKEVRAS